VHRYVDINAASYFARIDAVAHGIFDKRKKRHRRALEPAHTGFHVQSELQTVRHAHVHHVQVCADQFKFLAERRRGFLQARYRGTQIGDQAFQHVDGLWGSGLDQRLHVGKRVEQEVGFNLHQLQ
jgi:hypothetical protein